MATIKQRFWGGDDGKQNMAWRFSYTDAQGKRHKPQFPTKREAEAYRDEVLPAVRKGTHVPDSSSITLAEAGERWLTQRELDGVEDTSLASYRSRFRLHLKPRAIASEKLSRIIRPMVVALKTELQTDLSPAMARKCMTTLKMILNHAIEEGTAAVNIAATVKFKKSARPKQVVITTKEDLKTLITASALAPEEIQALDELPDSRKRDHLVQKMRTHAMIVVAIMAGPRASESRGLGWPNVDFTSHSIRIVERADIKGKMGAPKSRAGTRSVPMAPMVENVLTAWKKYCPKGDLGLVFPNEAGAAASHTNFVKREWFELHAALGWTAPSARFRQQQRKGKDGKPLLDQQGQPAMEDVLDEAGKRIEIWETRYNWHLLRHAYASLLIEQGFPAKRVQALMGHANISITMDLYGHLWPNEEDDHARLAKAQHGLISDAA